MLSKPLLVSYLVVLVLALKTASAEPIKRIGCFKDMSERDLFGLLRLESMTQEFCVNHCKSKGFMFAGLQAGDWCGCGNKFGRYGPVKGSDCLMTCSGDSKATCGGYRVNEIFETGLKIDGANRIGCFKDMPERDLLGTFRVDIMTREFCLIHCKSKGYLFAGMQFGDWCGCGNWYGRYGQVNDSECRKTCPGDHSATCGGKWVNEMFETGLPIVFMQRIGCFKDKSDRDMPGLFSLENMTRELCVNHCKSKGIMFAGLQAGRWCSCGNEFGRYGPAKDSECREKCSGDPSVTCGGNMENEMFTTGVMIDIDLIKN